MLDITKPLRQGIWVLPENYEEEICIILLYERLSDFCFSCGRLGHVIRDCGEKVKEGSELPFGNWLRANNIAGDRKSLLVKANISLSSGSPSVSSHNLSRGKENLKECTPVEKGRVATVSVQDKGDSDDNLRVELDHMIESPLFSEKDLPKLLVNNKDKDAIVTGSVGLDKVKTGGRMKWKSMARNFSANTMRVIDNSNNSSNHKRSLPEPLSSSISKKACFEDGSENALVSFSEAALQSRRSQ